VNVVDAFEFLNLEQNATISEIEKRYWELANKYHPDKGGNDGQMAKLNQAKQICDQSNSSDRNLVPIEAVASIVQAIHDKDEKKNAIQRRIANTRANIRNKSTNRLHKYRLYSGIAAAISAGALFLLKDFPLDALFSSSISHSAISAEELALRELENKRLSSLIGLTTANFAIYAGLFAGYCSFKIGNAESKIAAPEEQTSTKYQLFAILKVTLGSNVTNEWTANELSQAIAIQIDKLPEWKPLIRTIGADQFAQFLVDKGLDIELLTKSEQYENGDFYEFFSVRNGK